MSIKDRFLPGAHGIPDASRVEDDGDSRNIELPYSKVNHLKVTIHQQYAWEKLILSGDLGSRTITVKNGVLSILTMARNPHQRKTPTKNSHLI